MAKKKKKTKSKQAKKDVYCLWCGKVLAYKDIPLGFHTQLIKHLLHCKNHPLTKRIEELFAENQQLKALCLRESKVLKEALKRKNNKSMIKVVAGSLEEHGIKLEKVK